MASAAVLVLGTARRLRRKGPSNDPAAFQVGTVRVGFTGDPIAAPFLLGLDGVGPFGGQFSTADGVAAILALAQPLAFVACPNPEAPV